jgi:hypothetical protein
MALSASKMEQDAKLAKEKAGVQLGAIKKSMNGKQ